MRAILEDVRSGEVTGHEVPQRELRPGGTLVRTAFSAIRAGTELAHREQLETSLPGKSLARPDRVRQVVDFARTAGVKAAYSFMNIGLRETPRSTVPTTRSREISAVSSTGSADGEAAVMMATSDRDWQIP